MIDRLLRWLWPKWWVYWSRYEKELELEAWVARELDDLKRGLKRRPCHQRQDQIVHGGQPDK